MSALTDSIGFNLHCDLESILDAYQLSLIGTGAELWPDATPLQAAAWYLAHSLFKKYNDEEKPSKEASQLALQKFLTCNAANEAFQIQYEYLRDEELVNGVAAELHSFWYTDGETPLVSTFNQLYECGRLGKGSNRGSRDVNFYTKLFDGPLSHTSDSLKYIWEKLSQSDPRFFQAEQVRSNRYGFKKVEGNSLSFVNKNVNVARPICTEPTINMWFQLGMESFLTRRLKTKYGVCLESQPDINASMARTGSKVDYFATVDMESASDLISLNLVSRIVPNSMLSFLMKIRSPTVRLPSGEVCELHSISTMGNGFTFPLMTAIFCAVITTVYKHLNISTVRCCGKKRNYSVFGDDLIVVPKAIPLLYRLLGLLGFRVNSSKSFVEGPFRESCGSDFYLGKNVRGVYIKRLKSHQDHVVAINALNRWSARTGIALPSTVKHILRSASKLGRVFYGPADENDDSCIHVPFDMARGTVQVYPGSYSFLRYLPKVPYLEIDVEAGTITDSRAAKRRKAGRDDFLQSGFNPHGLWLSFLQGTVRSNRISLQAKGVTTYYAKPRVSFSWDILAPHRRHKGVSWRRWSDAVRQNLT